jgi:adenylate cyclase
MALEIERKYLLKSDAWRALVGEGQLLRQGYLSTTPERTVRVRVVDQQAWLTIKGISQGIARLEYEYAIPPADAMQMLDALCPQPLIEKYRYRIADPAQGIVWEIDEFLGANQGLIVAEVELTSTEQTLNLPEWIGQEVSDDTRYFNSALLKHPYKDWQAQAH